MSSIYNIIKIFIFIFYFYFYFLFLFLFFIFYFLYMNIIKYNDIKFHFKDNNCEICNFK